MEEQIDIGDAYYVSHTFNKDRVETLNSIKDSLSAVLLSLEAITVKDHTVNDSISKIKERIQKVDLLILIVKNDQ